MADSMIRKGPDLLEFHLDVRRDAQLIRMETSPDLVTWSEGFEVPSKNGFGYHRNKVFATFVPSSEGLQFPFYVRIRPVTGGTPGTPGPVYIAHRPSHHLNQHFLITGTAPEGSDVSESVEILLPGAGEIWIENNHGSNNLFVAFDEGGSEHNVAASNDLNQKGHISRIFLRGSAATTTFDLHYTLIQ